MIKKLTFVLLLIALSFSFLYGQTTRINGQVKNAVGYEIKLKVYADFLSMAEQCIAEAVIQEDGSFVLEAALQEIKLGVLVIGFQKAEIYLEPDHTYKLSIIYDKSREQITFVNNPFLNFQFIDLPATDLNLLIGQFNVKANNFLTTNFNRIYKRRDKKVIPEFGKAIRQEFQNPSEYFKNYIDFRLASIEFSAGLTDRHSVYQTYLQNQSVWYSHDEYAQLFHQLFDKFLMKTNDYFEIKQLTNLIFGNADLALIYSILNPDPLLQKRSLKELALLKGLYELYFHPSTNKKAILSLIEKIGHESLIPENKKIAKNLSQQLTYLQLGTSFPEDYLKELLTLNQKTATSEKAVFLNFFALPCADCVIEMDSIQVVARKYNDDVQFVSIALNTTDEAIQVLNKAKGYEWEIINASRPFKLAEAYRLKTLPAYFLIDSNGKIRLNPALVPWKGFSQSFRTVFKY